MFALAERNGVGYALRRRSGAWAAYASRESAGFPGPLLPGRGGAARRGRTFAISPWPISTRAAADAVASTPRSSLESILEYAYGARAFLFRRGRRRLAWRPCGGGLRRYDTQDHLATDPRFPASSARRGRPSPQLRIPTATRRSWAASRAVGLDSSELGHPPSKFEQVFAAAGAALGSGARRPRRRGGSAGVCAPRRSTC